MTQNITVSYIVSATANSISDIVASLNKKYTVDSYEVNAFENDTEYCFELSNECEFVEASPFDWYCPDEPAHVSGWATESDVLSDVENAIGVPADDYGVYGTDEEDCEALLNAQN